MLFLVDQRIVGKLNFLEIPLQVDEGLVIDWKVGQTRDASRSLTLLIIVMNDLLLSPDDLFKLGVDSVALEDRLIAGLI